MKKYLLFALSLAVSLASCKKENADSYYFHLHYVINGERHDYYQGEPQKPERRGIFGSISDPKDAFSDVIFRHLEVTLAGESSPWGRKTDMLQFTFGYDFGSQWNWYILSKAVEDGAKYYWDTEQPPVDIDMDIVDGPLRLCRFSAPCDTRELEMTPKMSGWMSFTRQIDDPKIALRVEFEADAYYSPEKQFIIREGRIDFTRKMTIIGLEYIQ